MLNTVASWLTMAKSRLHRSINEDRHTKKSNQREKGPGKFSRSATDSTHIRKLRQDSPQRGEEPECYYTPLSPSFPHLPGTSTSAASLKRRSSSPYCIPFSSRARRELLSANVSHSDSCIDLTPCEPNASHSDSCIDLGVREEEECIDLTPCEPNASHSDSCIDLDVREEEECIDLTPCPSTPQKMNPQLSKEKSFDEACIQCQCKKPSLTSISLSQSFCCCREEKNAKRNENLGHAEQDGRVLSCSCKEVYYCQKTAETVEREKTFPRGCACQQRQSCSSRILQIRSLCRQLEEIEDMERKASQPCRELEYRKPHDNMERTAYQPCRELVDPGTYPHVSNQIPMEKRTLPYVVHQHDEFSSKVKRMSNRQINQLLYLKEEYLQTLDDPPQMTQEELCKYCPDSC